MYKWLFASRISQAQFHTVDMLLKRGIDTKIEERSIKIYTNEMSMIHGNTSPNEYFPIMRIPCLTAGIRQ
jgi:hypothetical protein